MEALEADKIPVSFTRIAFADDWSETFAYQASVRVADHTGSEVSLPRMLDMAKRAGILFPVDRACRVTAIQESLGLAHQHPIFIPFSPSSIYDPEYCLATTVAAARKNGTPLDSIVFTILAPESDDDGEHLQTIIEYYRSHGFKVAMAGLGAGFTAFDLLPKLRPDTIFLDPSLPEQVLRDPFYAVIARKLLQIAHRLDIESVIDGVRDEAQAQWAYENGANYVSGPLVAEDADHETEAA
jgi:EAL domain-containing protein (putative c-di-GMP-specific phosphodiesterase class I)